MESKCHIGRVCKYQLEGGIDIAKHGMKTVLEMIETGPDVPECVFQRDCEDCSDWTFVDDEEKFTEL